MRSWRADRCRSTMGGVGMGSPHASVAVKSTRIKIASAFMVLAIGHTALAEVHFPLCFERLPSGGVKATSGQRWRFQVIPDGGLDNQTEYFTEREIKNGETIVLKGGQSQDYIQILELASDRVRIRHYGFARGIGSFDDIKNVSVSERCIINEFNRSSGAHAPSSG